MKYIWPVTVDSYVLRMFYQTFSINQNLYYLSLLLCEHDQNSAILAANSGHLVYRKLFSNFRTSFISVVIYIFFHFI